MKKVLITAVVALVAMLLPSIASASNDTQRLVVDVTPNKLDKKKFKPAKIFVDVITENNDEGNPDQPPSADRTRVDFSPNMKFTPSAVPQCDVPASQLNNTTTQQAIAACGEESVVSVPGEGKTEATVVIDFNPAAPGTAPTVVDVVVTAFNGFEKDSFYLHARADAVNNTSILPAKLVAGPPGFGRTLDVTIPDLLAGAIADFKTTVKAGKYVQARCKDKTPTFQARTEYENHSDTTATASDPCKQKKKKKKKN